MPILVGGVFIVIFVGIGLACITLGLEYWWYKFKKPAEQPADLKTITGKQQRQITLGKLSVTGLADYTNQPQFRSRNPARRQIHPQGAGGTLSQW